MNFSVEEFLNLIAEELNVKSKKLESYSLKNKSYILSGLSDLYFAILSNGLEEPLRYEDEGKLLHLQKLEDGTISIIIQGDRDELLKLKSTVYSNVIHAMSFLVNQLEPCRRA